MRWKQVVCSLVSLYFNSPQLSIQQKQTVKTLDYWSRDMLNFNFSEKGMGLVFPPHFEHDFSRKMFLILHFINWPNYIVWLPLLLEILANICITLVLLTRLWRIKIEINLIFLIKPFWYMTEKSRQKLRYLEYSKSFSGEIKSIFHHF